MTTLQATNDITLDQAHAAVEAALRKSQEMGVRMDIAVVDAGASPQAHTHSNISTFIIDLDLEPEVRAHAPLTSRPLLPHSVCAALPTHAHTFLISRSSHAHLHRAPRTAGTVRQAAARVQRHRVGILEPVLRQ